MFCVGSANEIPLQNSSTFNKFCCPYLVVSSSPLGALVADAAGLAVLVVLYALRESRRFFAAALIY